MRWNVENGFMPYVIASWVFIEQRSAQKTNGKHSKLITTR